MVADGRVVVTSDNRGLILLTLDGDFDLANADELRRVLSSTLHGGQREVTLDMSGVGFVDSTVLGVLATESIKGMTLTLRGAPDTTRRLLATAGLDRTIRVED